MEDKEKLTALVEMGFTTEEALALVKGNYRTVPDQKPEESPKEAAQDQKPEDGTPDQKPEEASQDQKPEEGKPDQSAIEKYFSQLREEMADLKKTMQLENIKKSELPPKESVDDILATFINPKLPEAKEIK